MSCYYGKYVNYMYALSMSLWPYNRLTIHFWQFLLANSYKNLPKRCFRKWPVCSESSGFPTYTPILVCNSLQPYFAHCQNVTDPLVHTSPINPHPKLVIYYWKCLKQHTYWENHGRTSSLQLRTSSNPWGFPPTCTGLITQSNSEFLLLFRVYWFVRTGNFHWWVHRHEF